MGGKKANQKQKRDECEVMEASDVVGAVGLKEFIKEENKKNRGMMTADLKRCFDEKFKEFERSLNFAVDKTNDMEKRVMELEATKAQSDQVMAEVMQRLYAAEKEMDDMRQHQLLNWLTFSGRAVPRLSQSNRRQDPRRLLAEMTYELMGYTIDMEDVLEVNREEYRLNVLFSSSAPDSTRDFLFRNKTKLQGTGLFIGERLAPSRRRQLNLALAQKRAGRLDAVFTRGGTVYVVQHGGNPRPVHGEMAMERLVRQLEEEAAADEHGRHGPAAAPRADERPESGRRSPAALRGELDGVDHPGGGPGDSELRGDGYAERAETPQLQPGGQTPPGQPLVDLSQESVPGDRVPHNSAAAQRTYERRSATPAAREGGSLTSEAARDDVAPRDSDRALRGRSPGSVTASQLSEADSPVLGGAGGQSSHRTPRWDARDGVLRRGNLSADRAADQHAGRLRDDWRQRQRPPSGRQGNQEEAREPGRAAGAPPVGAVGGAERPDGGVKNATQRSAKKHPSGGQDISSYFKR